ncbi:MAG: glycosyltransferase family 39 protein [Planctomycetes bacterium]|nr:glycosyltransferase family 39 protein [Planctomycetota bacterium]
MQESAISDCASRDGVSWVGHHREGKVTAKRLRAITNSRLMLAVILLGSLARLWGVDRPLDHRLANAWRSSDYTQIARNFHRESLNPFYPRIDWRGDTPGFVEMEFPLLPWLAALCDRAIGYNEDAIRLFAAAFSIGALLLFSRLARAMLPPVGATFAAAAFAFSPLLVKLGNAMQPEPVMIFFAVLFVLRLVHWQRRPTNVNLLIASACLAAASLAKPPCAIVGLVLLVVVIQSQGVRAFAKPFNYFAALVAAIPVIAWVVWANRFWKLYGNSLGVSNESHWLTWDALWPPEFLIGNLRWESLAVWTPLGWFLGVFALQDRSRGVQMAGLWYLAICLFYLIAGGTSGDDWASYYHSASVPPACLLMGAGLSCILGIRSGDNRLFTSPARARTFAISLSSGVIALLVTASFVAVYRRDHHEDLFHMRQCALELSRIIPADGRIVVRGGEKYDELGRPVAYNEPMMFAWMDRKGFNYARSDLSVDTLQDIARRGGQYWIARADELRRMARHADVDNVFRRISACQCGDYCVFDLTCARLAAQHTADRAQRSGSP